MAANPLLMYPVSRYNSLSYCQNRRTARNEGVAMSMALTVAQNRCLVFSESLT